ncbi:ABC transporter ATP-binding protein [Pseudogemmobacter bohemicus]|uniref:ABC transporter ATP-binding protein n=1 Tax=Pseudogemmobacter bohemicus TaxID=2250708 RepID=UPI000DD31CE5|nr:ABC transporter ATP-binding protein [Pseudogemmobacter bohemicus]
MSAFLSVQDLEKRFGTQRAVDGVSLDIRQGEFFALLGASGSGKTTLLRMLAGFEAPSSGRVLLDGQDITALAPNRRPVNLMFQSYALFPHMTVAKNIAYGLEMERLARGEIAARVDEMLAKVQLAHLAGRKPDQLSGGQRQRVALARALVKRPKLLLLDEPLGALDKKLRSEMQLELKRIQHEFGITFIVVTHDQEEALVMADRIAILKDGSLLQCGTPREVYEQPLNRFAAEFIGVMNFIPLIRNGDSLTTMTGAPISTVAPVPNDVQLVAAVRPERLEIGPLRLDTSASESARPDNRLTGTITALAYHGLDLQLHIATDAAPIIARLTADQAESRDLGPGKTVTLSWKAADTKLFPA